MCWFSLETLEVTGFVVMWSATSLLHRSSIFVNISKFNSFSSCLIPMSSYVATAIAWYSTSTLDHATTFFSLLFHLVTPFSFLYGCSLLLIWNLLHARLALLKLKLQVRKLVDLLFWQKVLAIVFSRILWNKFSSQVAMILDCHQSKVWLNILWFVASPTLSSWKKEKEISRWNLVLENL